MFPNAKALALFVSCALLAGAQSTSSASAPASETSAPAGLTTCLLDCVSQAATTGGCASYTDISCVCTSTTFQSAATECLQTNCSAEELAAGQALQEQECAGLTTGASTAASTLASGTATGTATTPSVTTHPVSSVSSSSSKASSSTTAKTSTTASQSATSSSAAMALSAPFSLGSFVGTLLASAGALVGAAFVL